MDFESSGLHLREVLGSISRVLALIWDLGGERLRIQNNRGLMEKRLGVLNNQRI